MSTRNPREFSSFFFFFFSFLFSVCLFVCGWRKATLLVFVQVSFVCLFVGLSLCLLVCLFVCGWSKANIPVFVQVSFVCLLLCLFVCLWIEKSEHFCFRTGFLRLFIGLSVSLFVCGWRTANIFVFVQVSLVIVDDPSGFRVDPSGVRLDPNDVSFDPIDAAFFFHRFFCKVVVYLLPYADRI